ncbi:MAG: cadherin domain-containing protein, partial [Hormoscilla sp. GM102CHS1]|nr:cadherin domain-containing protein [Hormoscilla sp. GM102CHS1]
GSIDIDGDGNNDLTSNGGNDSYVAKFDSNGDLVKALNIGGSSTDYGYGIATDSNGNVWATGTFWGNIDIDGDGNNDLTSNGGNDSYVAKFDSNGDLVKALNIGGSSRDVGRSIATDNNGNVWATGFFEGSIDIDGDGNNDLTSNGGNDSYVAKFDRNGDLVKALNIGGSSSDYGSGIATDSNSNAWTTGFFKGSIDNNDLTSDGNSDSYVLKFSEATSIDENVAANTVIGTFSTTDPDTEDISFTYELVAGAGDTDNDAFTIVGDELRIRESPDLETQSSYSIRVRTTDAGGESYSENLTINISDVNEDPIDLNLDNNSINENSVANTVVVSTTGPDTGDTFTDPTTITGNSQNDIILRGTASGETIQGLAGSSDILHGKDGDDLLDGGAGKDKLHGNAGSDTFVLAPGMGRDIIFNFEDGTDKMGLGGGGLSFSNLEIVGSGSSIGLNTGKTLATLRKIDDALIGADDFV